MSAEVVTLTIVVRELEGGVRLREALLFPEVVACDTRDARQLKALRHALRQVAEELAAIDVHRRTVPADAAVEQFEVVIEPPAKSAAWVEPLRLGVDAVRWRHGDDAHVAYIPSLGIEVIAAKEADLRRLVPEHVLVALRRTETIKSIYRLAQLDRTAEMRLEREELSVTIQGPKDVALAEEREAAREPEKLVIDDVGQVLPKYAAERAFELDDVVARIAEALTGRGARSVLLVGPAGVGKTAAVRELARRRDDFHLGSTPFWGTSGARLVAGQSGFGMWQKRCQQFCREASKHRAVVHLGNLVELMEVGRSEMVGQGIASFLRPFIGRGELLAVAECTPEQLPVIEKQDPHLLATFTQVAVDEPPPEVARRILARSAEARATRGARVTPQGLDALDRLHRRYAGYSAYPGRPLRFLRDLINDLPDRDAAGPAEVSAAFARETGLPPFMLDDAVPLDLAAAREWFTQRVIGQGDAVDLVTDLLATVKAGLNRPRRPIASLLFIGPTGVGKTEMAKSLAAYFFGDAGRVSRFDMSEYADPVAVRRLVGGTFGGAEGLLTAKVREQPFSVVLLDEFEKADPSLFDLLLQVLGEARLTDAAGRVADFSNAVVVMTSNLGAESFQRGAFGLGAHAARKDFAAAAREHFLEAVRSFLRPELFNRIDRVVPFLPLEGETVRGIVERELSLLARRDGFRVRGLELEAGPAVVEHLAHTGYDPLYGARPLKRAVERELLVPLADGANRYAEKTRLRAAVEVEPDDAGLRVTVRARREGDAAGPTSADAADLALLATRATAQRRDVQAMLRSAAAMSMRNELFAIERAVERETRQLRRTKRPPAYDETRESRRTRVKSVADAVESLSARVVALEDEALAAVYEGTTAAAASGAMDRSRLRSDLEAAGTDFRAVLLSLYALRHPDPDRVVVATYGHPASHLFALASAYRDAAAGFGATAAVHWYRRHDAISLVREALADDQEVERFLADTRPGTVGIGLVLRGPNVLPRFEQEKGLHVMLVDDQPVAQLLVDVADGASAYSPPEAVVNRTGRPEAASPTRRKYGIASLLVKDESLGRELRWDGQDLADVLSRAVTQRLDEALRAMVGGE